MPIAPGRSSCGSRSRPSSTKRGTKARRAGSRCAPGNMPTRSPSAFASWSTRRLCLPSTGKPLTPGDILVLVRSRGELASLIVARLFSAGVPVAGVDRLHLHEPLAVQDLLAAVKFAVQPNDDLSLACLLVSPLIGWDQDQLRALAYGRKASLWRELRRRAGESDAFRCGARRARRTPQDRRLHHSGASSSKRSCPGRCRGGASSTRASAWPRATRSTS